MGILRSDRVSGLGGANAINGSVFFSNYSWMNVEPDDEFTVGSGDFTIECWVNVSALVTYATIFSYRPKNTNGIYLDVHYNSGWALYVNSSYVISGGGASGTSTLNTWAHLALCKSGSSTKLFIDGAQVGSTYSDSNTYLAATEGIALGALGYNRNALEPLTGHISNFRIIKGEALYTSAFTVPAQRLTKTANTVLLCCQSPGDITKEETGKIITPQQYTTTTSYPKASRFAPDLGEDHGTTLGDNTKFDTLSYLVSPGGTTAESNRGRALFGGGWTAAPTQVKTIDYVEIQSMGTASDFGDLTQTEGWAGASGAASATRGIFPGGVGGSTTNIIEYVTIATTSNAVDFGDMTAALRYVTCCSNQTRGLIGGGSAPGTPGGFNTIQYLTIASAGNAADFGDLTAVTINKGSCGSSTRGLWAGGQNPSYINIIEYSTIATAGNATDFGDLNFTSSDLSGLSSQTRGIFAGGYISPSPNVKDDIDYVTIASTGNATDFGNLVAGKGTSAPASNSIRGVLGGGLYYPARTNFIDYITIATTGNAADFGDMSQARDGAMGLSDSHGGIS